MMESFIIDILRAVAEERRRSSLDQVNHVLHVFQGNKECGDNHFQAGNYIDADNYYAVCEELAKEVMILFIGDIGILAQVFQLYTRLWAIHSHLGDLELARQYLFQAKDFSVCYWIWAKTQVALSNNDGRIRILQRELSLCRVARADPIIKNTFLGEWISVIGGPEEEYSPALVLKIVEHIDNRQHSRIIVNNLYNKGYWPAIYALLSVVDDKLSRCASDVPLRLLLNYTEDKLYKNGYRCFCRLIYYGASLSGLSDESEPDLFSLARLVLFSQNDPIGLCVLMADQPRDYCTMTNNVGQNLADYVVSKARHNVSHKHIVDCLAKFGVFPLPKQRSKRGRQSNGPVQSSAPDGRVMSLRTSTANWTAFTAMVRSGTPSSITDVRTKKNAAMAHYSAKRFDAAVKAFTAAIKLSDDPVFRPLTTSRDLAVLYAYRAESLVEVKQGDRALEDVKVALSADPSFHQVHARAAKVYQYQKLYHEVHVRQMQCCRTCNLSRDDKITRLVQLAVNMCKMPPVVSATPICDEPSDDDPAALDQSPSASTAPDRIDYCEEILEIAPGRDFLDLTNQLSSAEEWRALEQLLNCSSLRYTNTGTVPALFKKICSNVNLRRLVENTKTDENSYSKIACCWALVQCGVPIKTLGNDKEPPLFGLVRLYVHSLLSAKKNGCEFDALPMRLILKKVTTLSEATRVKKWQYNKRDQHVWSFVQELDFRTYLEEKNKLLDLLHEHGIECQSAELPTLSSNALKTIPDALFNATKTFCSATSGDSPPSLVSTGGDSDSATGLSDSATGYLVSGSGDTASGTGDSRQLVVYKKQQTAAETCDRIKSLIELGQIYDSAEDFFNSVNSYNIAIDLVGSGNTITTEDQSALYMYRASSYRKMNSYAQALSDARQAVNVHPKSEKAILFFAELLSHEERFSEAVDVLLAYLERTSANTNIHTVYKIALALVSALTEANIKQNGFLNENDADPRWDSVHAMISRPETLRDIVNDLIALKAYTSIRMIIVKVFVRLRQRHQNVPTKWRKCTATVNLAEILQATEVDYLCDFVEGLLAMGADIETLGTSEQPAVFSIVKMAIKSNTPEAVNIMTSIFERFLLESAKRYAVNSNGENVADLVATLNDSFKSKALLMRTLDTYGIRPERRQDHVHQSKHDNKPQRKHVDTPQRKHDDNPQRKHVDKPQQKHVDKPQQKHDDKPRRKHDDKPQQKHDDKSQSKHDDKSRLKHDDKPQLMHDDKPQPKGDDKPDLKHDDKPLPKQDDSPQLKHDHKPQLKHDDNHPLKHDGQKYEDKSQRGHDDKSHKKHGEKPQQKLDDKPQQKLDDNPRQKHNDKSRQKHADKPPKNPDVKPQQKHEEETSEKRAATMLNDKDPCDTCEDKIEGSKNMIKSDTYESLLSILEATSNHSDEHEKLVDKSLVMIGKKLKEEKVIPDRILNLPADMYHRLLKNHLKNWKMLVKLLRPIMDDTESDVPQSVSTRSDVEPSVSTRSDVEPSVSTRSDVEPSVSTRSDVEPSVSSAVTGNKSTRPDVLKLVAKDLDLTQLLESTYFRKSPDKRHEVIRLLLRAGASAMRVSDTSQKTPLQLASDQSDWTSVLMVMKHGADPIHFCRSKGDTPQHAALSVALNNNGDIAILEFLHDLHVQEPNKYLYLRANVQDYKGDTLLHIIAKVKFSDDVLKIAKYLHSLNIDPDIVNNENKLAQDYLTEEDPRYVFLKASLEYAADLLRKRTKKMRLQKLEELVDLLEKSSEEITEVFELEESDDEADNDENSDTITAVEKIDICEDMFEELAWEVECTNEVWNALLNKSLDGNIKRQIVSQIGALASGDWQQLPLKKLRCNDGVELYGIKLCNKLCIIWEVAITFSEQRSKLSTTENKTMRMYSEIIRIWDIVADVDKIDPAVIRITRSHTRGQQSIVRKRLRGRSSVVGRRARSGVRRLPALFVEATEEDRDVTVWTPPASCHENEYHIMKFYAFNTAMVKYILEREGTKVEFPYKVTDLEYTYIRLELTTPSPILLLGRSGTGKTTCCLYRMWSKFVDYWAVSQPEEARMPRRRVSRLQASDAELEAATDAAADDANDDQDDPSDNYDHLHQIFVTKNPMLTRQVRKNFEHMCITHEAVNTFTASNSLPTSFNDTPSTAFPMFVTSRQLLLILDGSMPNPFFKRDQHGAMLYEVEGWGRNEDKHLVPLIGDEGPDETEVVEVASGRKADRREVTYEVFAHHLWNRLKNYGEKKSTRDYHPSLVWMEIVSFIKGSFDALKTSRGYLTLEEYRKLGVKMAPNFTADRDEIHKIFTAYHRICINENYFDESDVVYNIYHRLLGVKSPEWAIHQVYVDEVQDFTQSELNLLIHICNYPNAMFFTGDTAQSIMRGVAFRFSDLKTLFHSVRASMRAAGCKEELGVPEKVYELKQNYRSHAGVIRLANSVIALLNHFFPHSFDHAEKDSALFVGPKPVFFDAVNFQDLALILRGNERQSSQIEFGANQAILVANDKAKANIPIELRGSNILTIYESKGLEFDDILLFNFFKDSEASKEWRVVTQYLNELCDAQKEAGDHQPMHDSISPTEVDIDVLDAKNRSHPMNFKPDMHKILNSELKYLYTAITRARVNVWMYDQDTEARKPMMEYFTALHVVTSQATMEGDNDEKVFVKQSSAGDWRRKGKEFFRNGLFQSAAKCFLKARDEALYKVACAQQSALSAKNKTSQKERREDFLLASEQFFECPPSRDLYEQAARCLKSAGEFILAARVLERIGKLYDAANAYKRGHRINDAIRCYNEVDYYDEAVKILCEMKRYEHALLVWGEYEKKIEEFGSDNDRLQRLLQHKPDSQYDKRKLVFRLAPSMLNKRDIEGVRTTLSSLDWTIKEIADWMVDQGRKKTAANFLEKEGDLLEAAKKYLVINDYDSAIKCLDRCKKNPQAKGLLADSYLVLCRRHYRNVKQKPSQSSPANSKTGVKGVGKAVTTVADDKIDFNGYMELALTYFTDLHSHKMIGECLLLKALATNQTKLIESAETEFSKASSEIGQLECLYKMLRKGCIVPLKKMKALKFLDSIFHSVKKESGTIYDDVLEFYGIEGGFIDPNKEVRIKSPNSSLKGTVHDMKVVNDAIHRDLLNKLRHVLQSFAKDFRQSLKSTTCAQFSSGQQCVSTCPNVHLNSPKKLDDFVDSYVGIMSVHGMILMNFWSDPDIRKLLEAMINEKQLDFTCSAKLVKQLFVEKIHYAENEKTTKAVLSKLHNDNTEAVLLYQADVQDKDENYVKTLSMSTNQLLMILYSSLTSRDSEKFINLSRLLTKSESISEGKWACDFIEDSNKYHGFRLCSQSFIDHYAKKDPYLALKTCNRYLVVTAPKSRRFPTLCPAVELILPIFELQFMRGMFIYTKLNHESPVFFPESYFRLLTLFDTACSSEKRTTRKLVEQYKIHNEATVRTNVRNQMQRLCEVFLGVRAREFDMMRAGVQSSDETVLERVVVFALVMLINVGFMIDENISFFMSKDRKVKSSVSLEEVIMRSLQDLASNKKCSSTRLSQLFQLVEGKGLRDIAQGLKEYVKNCHHDCLLEGNWIYNQGLTLSEAKSHETMENSFIDYKPGQTSNAYRSLQQISERNEELIKDERTEKTDIDNFAESEATPEKFKDVYVNELGCEICNFKLEEDVNSSESGVRNLQQEHAASPEHKATLKVYDKYKPEVQCLVKGITEKLSDLERNYVHIRDTDPDLYKGTQKCREAWKDFEGKKKEIERAKRWRDCALLINLANKFHKEYNTVLNSIEKCGSVPPSSLHMSTPDDD